MPEKRLAMGLLLVLAALLSAQDTEPLLLAVRDLTAQGMKEAEAAVISEQLRVELVKGPRIRLIERGQMEEVLKEQGFQQSGCTSDACAVEVGQLLGVRNIVVGSVGTAGSYTLLSVRVLDVGTGEILVTESLRTKGGVDQLLERGIARAAWNLEKKLFPEVEADAEEGSDMEKGKGSRALIIGGASAVVLGGGAVAGLLFLRSREGESEAEPKSNTRIELP